MDARDAGEQVEVVVDDAAGDGLARDEDEPRVREPEEHQREQHPLLVVVHAVDLFQLVDREREAGHDHDGPRCERIGEDALELLLEASL